MSQHPSFKFFPWESKPHSGTQVTQLCLGPCANPISSSPMPPETLPHVCLCLSCEHPLEPLLFPGSHVPWAQRPSGPFSTLAPSFSLCGGGTGPQFIPLRLGLSPSDSALCLFLPSLQAPLQDNPLAVPEQPRELVTGTCGHRSWAEGSDRDRALL